MRVVIPSPRGSARAGKSLEALWGGCRVPSFCPLPFCGYGRPSASPRPCPGAVVGSSRCWCGPLAAAGCCGQAACALLGARSRAWLVRSFAVACYVPAHVSALRLPLVLAPFGALLGACSRAGLDVCLAFWGAPCSSHSPGPVSRFLGPAWALALPWRPVLPRLPPHSSFSSGGPLCVLWLQGVRLRTGQA